MDEKYGLEHEQEVLAAFEKMKSEFSSKSGSSHTEAPRTQTPERRSSRYEEAGAAGVAYFGAHEMSKTADAPAKPVKEEHKAKHAAKKGAGLAAIGAADKASRREKPAKKARKPKETKVSEAPKEDKSGKKGGRGAKKGKWKKILKWLLIFCLVAAAAVGVYVIKCISGCPKIDTSNVYDLLNENSVILDVSGELVENVYAGESLRSNVEYNELPEDLIDAFVSIEDKTFWKHHGFNFVRIVGAVVDKLTGKSDRVGGTSTITQQLARNLYLVDTRDTRSMERKVQEAWYSLQLEHDLTKEQIIEAYLNTIYLGFNSSGVQAASQAYFAKDVKDLTLVECACLATLPKSPNAYSPLKRASRAEVEDLDSLDIISESDDWIIYYNDAGADRIKLVLRFMKEQGKITEEEYNAALETSVRDSLNVGTNVAESAASTYFADYLTDQVLSDLQTKLNMNAEEARDLLYNGGLIINSTLDLKIQHIMDDVYSNTSNFPAVGSFAKDAKGNVLDSNRNVLVYSEKTLFDASGNFVMNPDEFEWLADGSLKLLHGKRLNFYKTTVGGGVDYSIEFKNLYTIENKQFYMRSGGVWNIASEYKTRDDSGDLIISAQFFTDNPEIIVKNGDGTLTLMSKYYTLKAKVLEPQSAMVIMDHSNGHIVGMIGGRGIDGKRLFNRALSTRQPGSSIKPLAIYSVALANGYTAASALDDSPISYGGTYWPKNAYSGFTGIRTLRQAVENSINCCAVHLFMELDQDKIINQLQNMGITSLVTTGEINDLNASALALGGMTKGISPIEMCGAYGTFGNYGTYTEPICYTTVIDKRGNVLLERTPVTHEVMSQEVASLMTDILHTTVTHGIAGGAKLSSQPSAGKTGTTSDKYDFWFCGLTPKYTASCWIGNDVNIDMTTSSASAAKLWAKVMDQVGALDPKGEFVKKGEFVTATVDRFSGKLLTDLSYADGRGAGVSEIFIEGTVPGEYDNSHVAVNVCDVTGYLATPSCPSTHTKVGIVRPGGCSWEKMLVTYRMGGLSEGSVADSSYDAPDYYCPLHNPDKGAYPVSPRAENRVYEEPEVVQPEVNENEDPEVDVTEL